MKFEKPDPAVETNFRAAVGPIRDAEPRRMFGYESIFVNGNYAAGLWQKTCVFKLSDEDGARFVAEAGGVPFAPMGRPTKNWYEAPRALAGDGAALEAWCARAAAYARGLPPKAKKANARKTRAKSPKRVPAKKKKTTTAR
jgi:TfoX/Sxy family transcriptional regulator of competence genes